MAIHGKARHITLPHDFTPREFQAAAYQKLDEGVKRVISCWHRRAGKDIAGINYVAKSSQQRVGTYWHGLPSQRQARKVIWNGIDNDGKRILDRAIPKAIRKRTLEDEMMIELRNGSIIYIVGADNIDSLVGTNPVGVVLSEYAIMSPTVWPLLAPILRFNKGWCWFNSTPRGRNHYHKLYHDNLTNPLWYCETKSILDTGLMTMAEYAEERAAGQPEEKLKQEYLCDWMAANVGAIYAKDLENLRAQNKIGSVPYDRRYPVETAWDIGKRDATAIWFIQRVGLNIHVIDYYEKRGEGLPHFASVVNNKPYSYSRHVGPHDLEVTEWGTDATRRKLAENHGIRFTVAPKQPLDEGISQVRAILPSCRFDAMACRLGLAALDHYEREWDEEKNILTAQPVHNWASHGSDAFRYLASVPAGLGILPDWMRQEQQGQDRARQQGMMGHNAKHPLHVQQGSMSHGSTSGYDPLAAFRR